MNLLRLPNILSPMKSMLDVIVWPLYSCAYWQGPQNITRFRGFMTLVSVGVTSQRISTQTSFT